MKTILSFIAIVIIFASCTSTVQVQGENRGAEVVVTKQMMTYDELLTKLEKTEGFEDIQVEGKVSAVCQKKGCWMTLVSDDTSKEEMVVKFKDYAFFMPLDLAGKTVILQGNAYKETTSVDELRHYAEDAGQSEEEIAKITEPKVELKFEAAGVIIKEQS